MTLMHIELDTSVTHVHAPTHQVPMAKLDQENKELKRLYEEGITVEPRYNDMPREQRN